MVVCMHNLVCHLFDFKHILIVIFVDSLCSAQMLYFMSAGFALRKYLFFEWTLDILECLYANLFLMAIVKSSQFTSLSVQSMFTYLCMCITFLNYRYLSFLFFIISDTGLIIIAHTKNKKNVS